MHQVIRPNVLYFGTPVALVSTLSSDGSTNLSPISSLWALHDTYVLGLGASGLAFENLRRLGELVINLPEDHLASAIELIAPTTGVQPVPAAKRELYRTERDKWSLGGFTPQPSDRVEPARVAECGVQIEAKARQQVTFGPSGAAVFVSVERVHVREDLLVPGTSYIDVSRWSPLYYTFRHYFAQGAELGKSFKADS